jgi:ribosomal protein L29
MPNSQMAKQEREEFAGMDVAELRVRLENEKKKLWQDRFALGKRQLQDTSSIAKSRKRIARILTYLRQAELKQEVES